MRYGIMPFEKEDLERKKACDYDALSNYEFTNKDLFAMYIAAVQTLLPIALLFFGGYFIFILLVTTFWLK
jgi:hypothetical protein